jgi:hypothetical protein
MKRIQTALIALVFIGAISCDLAVLEDAIDNFAPVIALEAINTTGVVQIQDAATGELLTGRVEVTFTPPSGGQIIDIYSDPITNVAVTNGFVNFGISNNIVPSDNSPASVSLTFSANGYLPRTQTVNLTSTGSSDFRVRLVRESNPPQGIVVATSNPGSTSASGETTTALSIRPSGTAGSGQTEESSEVEVVIPSGSVILDASGNPLTGQLSARTQFYDTSVPAAMEGLPDNIQNLAQDQNALVFAAFELAITDNSGRRAASIGGGASKRGPNGEQLANDGMVLELNLPTTIFEQFYDQMMLTSVNPLTSEFTTVKLSDVTEVQSSKRAEVARANLRARNPYSPTVFIHAPVEHLAADLNIVRNGHTGALFWEASATGDRVSGILRNESSVRINRVTSSLAYRVRVWNAVTEGVVGSHNFGSTNTVTVNLPAPPPSLIDATVDIVLRCVEPSAKVRVTTLPGASIFYRKVGATGDWRQGTGLSFNYNSSIQALEGGEVTLRQVEQGSRYDIKVIFGEEEESSQLTITGTRVTHTETIDNDICS